LPLETATFIPDLVDANPAHTDGLSQADSHMRLIKTVLKNTFPNFTDVALASTQAELDAAVAATTGAAALAFAPGTEALPGLAPQGDPDTGFFKAAEDQIGVSLGGSQVMLLAGGALVTTLGIGAPAVASSGAFSGGTGQLVPIGAVLEWYDNFLPPEGGYCWANGQIIQNANVVAPVLLARWGNRFGGNGTTTMGVPNRCEVTGVGTAGMGGTAGRGLLNFPGFNVVGTVFGEQNHELVVAEMPSHFHTAGIFDPGHTHGHNANAESQGGGPGPEGNVNPPVAAATINPNVTGVRVNSANGLDTTNSAGGNAVHNNMQPSQMVNYILRLG
jgi:microcystin-dependent protein